MFLYAIAKQSSTNKSLIFYPCFSTIATYPKHRATGQGRQRIRMFHPSMGQISTDSPKTLKNDKNEIFIEFLSFGLSLYGN